MKRTAPFRSAAQHAVESRPMKEAPPASARPPRALLALLRLTSCLFCLTLCHSTAAAQADTYFEIVARHSGKCLDVEAESQAAGARVLQWDCGGWANQQWRVIPVGGGYSRLIARHSGKALDVSGGSTATGAQIHQWDYVGGGNQQWRLYPVSPAVEGRAQQGEWSPPKPWPFVAIHTTLLSNSKVLAWSRDKDGGGNDVAYSTQARVWDPVTDSFTTVANGRTNMFCSGHTALPDGRLLVTGGHNLQDGVGLPHTNIFKYNDSINPWAAGPDMNAGRWYPTNTTLANGEVLVVTGDTGAGHNTTPQVWQTNVSNPALESWRSLPARDFVLYPWMHVSPKDGRVFNSGPDGGNTGYLNTTTGAWTAGPPTGGNFYRGEGTSVMYDTGKIIILGGGSPPTSSAEIINLNATTPAWQAIAPMANARRHVNGTVLPDGTVLVTGGTSLGGNNQDGAVYAAELWNPAGAWPQWTTLASMRIPRLYHSTALLLPDGRVLSTGGGFGAGGAPYYEVEIFSPPYLFKGARPVLTSAPASVGYGQTFTVGTPHASSITKVTMVRLSSVTHSFNEDQRLATLPVVSVVSGGVNVTAPASGRHAPPGFYMLFILKGNGVPSEGRMIRIG